MTFPSRRCAGYTLTELVIVVTVIGITLAGGIPLATAYTRDRGFALSATRLKGELDLARNKAIAETNPYRIVFNAPKPGQYQVHDDNDADGVMDTGEKVAGPFALPSGVSFESLAAASNSVLTFEASGMLRAGQGGTISMKNAKGKKMTLEVYASGMAQVTAG